MTCNWLAELRLIANMSPSNHTSNPRVDSVDSSSCFATITSSVEMLDLTVLLHKLLAKL